MGSVAMALAIHKKGQGAAARGMSAVAMLLMGGWAASSMWHYGVPDWGLPSRIFMTALIAGLFAGAPIYLLLFHHQVADLMIETQQEMRKVAWSTRQEVLSSTAVVLVTVAGLSLFIFVTDMILLWLARVFSIY
jgi:preprotein translocase SecE subunit